jgi:hypothetical protein
MELPIISSEQNYIIQQLILNNNVVVDSVAGSGKTTCNLHIAKHFNDMKILLLTYNSKLKVETREKAKKLGINNIEVHSYHSLCVKYYDNKCFTDTIINSIIKNKIKPIRSFIFDLIVLDEAQDITSLYYELICKIYKDNKNINKKICIFGDKKQSIFDFNNADQRFIEYATELFNFNSYNWIRCNLPVSFRITYEMSLFINKCLLNDERIISNKITNNKPRYIICDCFDIHSSSRTFEELKYYFSLGYKPNDIFILAPSVKSQGTPVRKLENKIKKEMPNVMVYVPTSDDEKLDEELLEGKIIFSTFHQAKGLERKVVIIFNFDESYFKFYKKDANPYICSNELYVATSRGIHHLTLFHHNTNDYMPFINKSNIKLYCHFENSRLYINDDYEKNKNFNTSITDISKYLPQNIIDECYSQLEIIPNNDYIINKINIPLKISNETTESVSEITGIAIPSMFELKQQNKMSIYELLKKVDFENKVINNGCSVKLEKDYNINDINIENLKPEELLYISNCWNTYKTGYLFKIYQITNYNWLEEQKLNECINRLNLLNISINSSFEYKLEQENEPELLDRKLVGYIDCIDNENNIIYEFKCVQQLEKEHYLQLALYMYMYELEKNKNKNKLIKHLLRMKEKLINQINNNNFIETNDYVVGDIIKYKLLNEEIGEIIKIYKTTRKIKVKTNNNKIIDIPKTLIISVKRNIDIDKLNNELENINKQIQEKEIIKITKYILFNILTNEYIEIKCELNKLKNMVKYLIYSKYINDNSITDEEFINYNNTIKLKYLS